MVDFSALFQDVGGAGLGMKVMDAAGDVLGTGDRFRVVVAQGSVLTIHVFGEPAEAGGLAQGSGDYTLDIDVLPQVVSVRALSPIPGGPITSIVLTFQGDSLDPASAEDPANYSVIFLGPGVESVVPIAATSGGQSIIYDPGVNVDVTSGLTYPTAVDQTVTLLFAQPLAAGSYEIVLSPAIQAAAFNAAEAGELAAGDGSFAGHPVVTVTGSLVVNGASLYEPGLVQAPVGPTVPTPRSGVVASPFLTQLVGDLTAVLDQGLQAALGDSAITAAVNDEILARYLPLYASPGSGSTKQTLPSFAIIWLDPVSISLQSPQGLNLSYNLSTNAVSNGLGSSFVSVGGNVEMIVMENAAGTFNLDVANVAATAQGGAVVLSAAGVSAEEFTAQLQGGETAFELALGGETGAASSPGSPGSPASPTVEPETSSSVDATLASNAAVTSAALLVGLVTFEEETSENSSTDSSGATAAAPTGGATGPGQPILKSYALSLSEDFAVEQIDEKNGPLSFQSIFQVLNQGLSRVSGVMDSLGRKPAAAVLRQFHEMLEKLGRPAIPGAARDRAMRNHQVKDANPGPAQAAPITTSDIAPESTPDQDQIDLVLWDHGIDGLLQERVPVDSELQSIGVRRVLGGCLPGFRSGRLPAQRTASGRVALGAEAEPRAAGVAPPDTERPRSTF